MTLTDWIFTAGGVALILIGAYGMAAVGHLDLRGTTWLVWGQAMFVASGVIWIIILIPTQNSTSAAGARIRQGRRDSRKLLAAWPALAHLGNDRYRHSFG